MHWLIATRDTDGADALRAAQRDAHVAHLKQGAPDVRFLLGSALSDDTGQTASGSWMVVSGPSRAAVAAFVAGDPFSAAGVFAEVGIARIAPSFDPTRYLK